MTAIPPTTSFFKARSCCPKSLRRRTLKPCTLPAAPKVTRWALITSQKVTHTPENLFVACIWAYKKVCTRRKGNPLGPGLVEASSDFTPKKWISAPQANLQASRRIWGS
ncbi:uncharacterized protein ACIBXB_015324 isoform 1-T1 [Morphnus guianensis]